MAKYLDSTGLGHFWSKIKEAIPTKTSDLTNDSGFITSAPVTSVNGQTGAVTIGTATSSADGLMSAADKAKVDSALTALTNIEIDTIFE